MNGNTTIELAFLISVMSIIMNIINMNRTRKRDEAESEEKQKKEIEEQIKVNMKLDQLCTITNDIKQNMNDLIYRLTEIEKRVSKLEQQNKGESEK